MWWVNAACVNLPQMFSPRFTSENIPLFRNLDSSHVEFTVLGGQVRRMHASPKLCAASFPPKLCRPDVSLETVLDLGSYLDSLLDVALRGDRRQRRLCKRL